MNRIKSLQNLEILVFGGVSLFWLIFGQIVGGISFLNPGYDQGSALKWTLVLWLLSVVDLFLLRMTVLSILKTLSIEGSGQGSEKVLSLIQTLIWGSFKLVCLGLFILILIKGEKIPPGGLLMGIGTLSFVPIAGGFFWNQKVLRNA